MCGKIKSSSDPTLSIFYHLSPVTVISYSDDRHTCRRQTHTPHCKQAHCPCPMAELQDPRPCPDGSRPCMVEIVQGGEGQRGWGRGKNYQLVIQLQSLCIRSRLFAPFECSSVSSYQVSLANKLPPPIQLILPDPPTTSPTPAILI